MRHALRSAPPAVHRLMRVLFIYPLRLAIRYLPWPTSRLLLFNCLADHLWWLEGHVDARTVHGSTLRVDASDIVGKHLYYFGIWEPSLSEWMRRSLKPGALVVDVGANIGYYSLLASNLVGPGGRVIAIEALPETMQRLRFNLDRNGATNVRAINSAAWSRVERLKIFFRQEGASGATTLMSDWADRWQLRRQIEIDAAPLSTLLSDSEIASARMIKIDVEGAEWEVISEMTSWLGRTAPDLEVAIEISTSMMAAQGKSFQDILELFREFGFFAYRVKNDYLAASCISWREASSPARISAWPDEQVDQIDVVFSRTDAGYL
jgi:FkbM family methyltransferase